MYKFSEYGFPYHNHLDCRGITILYSYMLIYIFISGFGDLLFPLLLATSWAWILIEYSVKSIVICHETRGVQYKHIFSVIFSFSLREQVKKNVVIQPIVLSDCIFCHSANLKKNGIRHNKSGDIQRFECLDCHTLVIV